MKTPIISRRDVLKGSTAFAAGTVFASPTLAAAHPLRLVGAAGTYLTGLAVLGSVLSTWTS